MQALEQERKIMGISKPEEEDAEPYNPQLIIKKNSKPIHIKKLY